MTLQAFNISVLILSAVVCLHNLFALFGLRPPVYDPDTLAPSHVWVAFQAVTFVATLRAMRGAWVVSQYQIESVTSVGLSLAWLAVQVGLGIALWKRHRAIEHGAYPDGRARNQ